MLNYTGMLQEAGVVEMIFWNRIRDDTIMQIKNGYHVRSLLYYIRTEKLNLNTILPIERIDLDVYVQDVSKKLELMNLEGITIDNVYSKIVDKWVNKNKFFEELNNG
jgi:glycine cleavage system aminomethyltransferase T